MPHALCFFTSSHFTTTSASKASVRPSSVISKTSAMSGFAISSERCRSVARSAGSSNASAIWLPSMTGALPLASRTSSGFPPSSTIEDTRL